MTVLLIKKKKKKMAFCWLMKPEGVQANTGCIALILRV
jgi:hypothetical protein